MKHYTLFFLTLILCLPHLVLPQSERPLSHFNSHALLPRGIIGSYAWPAGPSTSRPTPQQQPRAESPSSVSSSASFTYHDAHSPSEPRPAAAAPQVDVLDVQSRRLVAHEPEAESHMHAWFRHLCRNCALPQDSLHVIVAQAVRRRRADYRLIIGRVTWVLPRVTQEPLSPLKRPRVIIEHPGGDFELAEPISPPPSPPPPPPPPPPLARTSPRLRRRTAPDGYRHVEATTYRFVRPCLSRGGLAYDRFELGHRVGYRHEYKGSAQRRNIWPVLEEVLRRRPMNGKRFVDGVVERLLPQNHAP